MQQTTCLNCNEDLAKAKRFCTNCGQKTTTHRLSFQEILHETFHALFHADKGFIYLIKELSRRPGCVARDYINGSRKKYFNPFNFLVIVTGIVVLVSSNLGTFNDIAPRERPGINMNRMPLQQRMAIEGIQKRARNLTEFFSKHSNVVLFISTPFFAFLFWAFYRGHKLNYAEHLAAVVYYNAFIMIYTSLIFAPVLFLLKNTKWYFALLMLMLLSHVLYLSWGYKGLLNLKGVRGFGKSFICALLAVILWSVFTRYAGTAYVRWGP